MPVVHRRDVLRQRQVLRTYVADGQAEHALARAVVAAVNGVENIAISWIKAIGRFEVQNSGRPVLGLIDAGVFRQI